MVLSDEADGQSDSLAGAGVRACEVFGHLEVEGSAAGGGSGACGVEVAAAEVKACAVAGEAGACGIVEERGAAFVFSEPVEGIVRLVAFAGEGEETPAEVGGFGGGCAVEEGCGGVVVAIEFDEEV